MSKKGKIARDNNELRINFLEHELIDFGFDMKYEALLVIGLTFCYFSTLCYHKVCSV